MNKITLHCRRNKNVDFVSAWPRKNMTITDALGKWMGRSGFSIEVPNHFTDVRVFGVETRSSGTIVPQALLQLPDLGLTAKIDFRLDGVMDLLQYGSIEEGTILTPLHIKFIGASYRLLPIINGS